MRRSTRFDLASTAACVLVAQACTSYGPAAEPLGPSDRFRIVADSPFVVVTAGRDRVPTGRCQATKVTGRVLEVRGDTLVVGGSPILVPATGTSCTVSETAIFVAPPNGRYIDVRHADAGKTVWALSAAAFLVYVIDLLLQAAFPET